MIYEQSSKSSILENFICELMKLLYTYSIFFILPMAQITHDGFTFTLLDEIQSKYHELINLVLGSESIDNNEKQYWFDILPSMTNEQIDRLFNILMTERHQLEELNVKYQEEIKNLNEKHLIQWQSIQSKKTQEKIQQAEKTDTSKKDASDALSQFDIL